LTRIGHQVEECCDGSEALTLLKKEPFHLVLTDIKMPGMDGYELLRHIKKSHEFKDIVVVLITGFGGIKGAIKAIKEGAYDYVLKPVQIDELVALTERISEYIYLKQEHHILKDNFDRQVSEATRDVERELENVKKAYAREVGIAGIGIFSAKLRWVFQTAQKLHKNPDIPVLIEGETGTGKELIARYIHYGEGEITSPFVEINCAAISPTLFESELFGYEAGAFTGGNPKGQKGKIELAQGGTIFLDEISELTVDYQAKFLRVIEEKEYYRVGGLKKIKADVRFICSTNQDIKKKVENGSFREDLYYRLNVGYIKVPPLRERREEIIPLIDMFLKQLAEQKKARFTIIRAKARKLLEEYHWPGNVRELKNALERIALLWDDTEIKPEYLLFLTGNEELHLRKKEFQEKQYLARISLPVHGFKLKELISEVVYKAFEKHRYNKVKTAKYLGISRSSLYNHLKRMKN